MPEVSQEKLKEITVGIDKICKEATFDGSKTEIATLKLIKAFNDNDLIVKENIHYNYDMEIEWSVGVYSKGLNFICRTKALKFAPVELSMNVTKNVIFMSQYHTLYKAIAKRGLITKY